LPTPVKQGDDFNPIAAYAIRDDERRFLHNGFASASNPTGAAQSGKFGERLDGIEQQRGDAPAAAGRPGGAGG
jgi:hypothetical protein